MALATSTLWMAVASMLALFEIRPFVDSEGNVIEAKEEYCSRAVSYVGRDYSLLFINVHIGDRNLSDAIYAPEVPQRKSSSGH